MISIGFCNLSTHEIIQKRIDENIKKYCAEYSDKKIIVDPDLVKAICIQESDLKPYCVRLEPQLKKSNAYRSMIPKEYRDDDLAYSSLGVAQVMYMTAVQMGYTGSPEGLLPIEISCKYAVKYVKFLIGRYWQLEKVIAAYNAGSPRYTADKKFVNQEYVDLVSKNLKSLKTAR